MISIGLSKFDNRELSELAHIEIGRTPSRANPTYWGGSQKWLTISDFEHGDLIERTKEAITEEAITECGVRIHEPGTLVMSFKLTIGKLGTLGEPMATNEAIAALKPIDKTVIYNRYLFHFLSQFNFDGLLDRAAKGRTLNKAKLNRLPISFPRSIDEQRRIAAILDKADAIRRKRRQALAEIDTLLRATFLDMFGDPATNPKGFDVEPVQRVLSRDRAGTQSGPFGAALKKSELVAQGIPVWGIENVEHNSFNPTMRLFITPEKFAELERYDVRDGDVLISRAGTVGRMCIARPPVARSVLSTNLVRVSLDHSKMLPEYFVTLFTSFPDRLSQLRANKKDNAFSFLNPGTLKVLDIPQPDIKRQIEFARRVKALGRTKSLRAQAMEQANELFRALSQRAFRGEL